MPKVSPKVVKDPRVRQKRAAQEFAHTIEGVLSGEKTGRPGAEHHLFASFKWLVQLYLMGEGPLPDELRAVVAALMDPTDPLRRDIPPDTWAMLWPALNTLTHARNEAVRTQEKLTPPGGNTDGKETGREERREEGPGAGPGAGAGVVGAAAGETRSEEGGKR